MTETLNKFGIPIDGIRTGLLMPKLKHKFRVRFTNFGPLNSHQTVDLSRQVQTCTRPEVTQARQAIHVYNSIAYYAGKHEWSEITIEAFDDVTNSVTKLIGYQVQKQMNHLEQTSALAGQNYKFGASIEILDGGNEGVLETWTLEGCFLTKATYGGGDYKVAEPLLINMSISFDNAIQEGGLFPDAPEMFGGTRV